MVSQFRHTPRFSKNDTGSKDTTFTYVGEESFTFRGQYISTVRVLALANEAIEILQD